jgi:RNA polymerase sigma-70 factor (ECF subfamily)
MAGREDLTKLRRAGYNETWSDARRGWSRRMAVDTPFADFIRRIRAGDAQAAFELVQSYESVIRLEVRVRLSDPRLRRAFDSMDICQSVMASFFVRAAAGEFDLELPQDLVKLLVVMTQRKVAYQVRKERAQCRDNRRIEATAANVIDAAAGSESPSREIAGRELLTAFRKRLNAEERRLADLRCEGLGWAEIADSMGGTAQARRKQLERAIDRVTKLLGLDNAPNA